MEHLAHTYFSAITYTSHAVLHVAPPRQHHQHSLPKTVEQLIHSLQMHVGTEEIYKENKKIVH